MKYTCETDVKKLAEYLARCHKDADEAYYLFPDNQKAVDYFMGLVDSIRKICDGLGCTREVWAEAKKIYDFTNSGREGYTLRDGKIVKVEEAE